MEFEHNGQVLRPGASNPDDEYADGVSPAQITRIFDAIMADHSAPSSTPLAPGAISGVPRGYGRWATTHDGLHVPV
jgi:hypothetical protein